jgi:polyphosphate kinase
MDVQDTAEDELLRTSADRDTEDGPGDPMLRAVAHEPFDVEPPYTGADVGLPADRFLDRELSWLAFNERVLELAEHESLPLLERVRFAAIFSSNLDEFFMVRVAGLKRRIVAGVAVPAASGRSPRDTIREILRCSEALMQRVGHLFHDELVPTLARAGIELLRWEDLTDDEQRVTRDLFVQRIFPVLTPLAVDPAHPFPYISGLSLNLAVAVHNPDSGKTHFARVKIPPIFARWMPLGEERFVAIEDVIGAHLDLLFPGMKVVDHHAFRVTRNEDLEVEEDDAENLLKALEKELQRRRFGPPVRLEVEESIAPHVLDLLISELDVSAGEVMRLPGRWTCVASTRSRTWTGWSSSTPRSSRPRTPTWPRWRPRARQTCSAPSPIATCCCTTPTTPSPQACSASSSRPRPTRTSWRSSRRSTAPLVTRRSSMR